MTVARAVKVGLVASLVVVVDQVTKTLALRALDDGPVHLVWTLDLRLAFNSGFAFSQGQGMGPVIALIALGVVVYLVFLASRTPNWVGQTGLALVVGGAVGNLVDRMFRAGDGFLGGRVVDFIDLNWWPVFNVADMAITVGAVLVILGVQRE